MLKKTERDTSRSCPFSYFFQERKTAKHVRSEPVVKTLMQSRDVELTAAVAPSGALSRRDAL